MGLEGSLRRDTPDWTSGPTPVATTAGPPEAKPYDPDAVKLTSPAPAPAPKVEAKAEQPPEAAPINTPDITERTTATPAAKSATPPAKTPAAKAPTPKADPIGDLVQEKATAPEPQPDVPF